MNSTEQRTFDGSLSADLRATLVWLREKMQLIISCFLVAGIAGALYAMLGPKIYRAEAVIQVGEGEQKVFKTDGVEARDPKGEGIAKTIEQSLTSPGLLLGLIERNGLNKDPAFLPGLKRPVSNNKMVEELARHISAQVRRGTQLIDIKVEDRSPVMAQKIADLLVTEFVHENLKQHIEASEMAYDFLLQQAERLKGKLARSQEALQAYKEQNQGVSLEEKQNIVVAKLVELNRLVTEAKAARIKLEADDNQVKKRRNGSPADLLGVPAIANAPSVVELQKNITVNEGGMATLKNLYGERHPIYLAAVNQLQELKANLERAILKAADVAANAYDAAVATEKTMEDSLREQERLALELNKISIPYGVLTREAETDRALYESVLTRLKEINVTKDIAQDAIRMVSHPLLPEEPASPNIKRVLLLSIFGGLALSCGLSLASRVLNGSFKTVDDAERRLGMPALGIIPRCATLKLPTDNLLLVKQPDSATAESFRTLRTSLSLLGRNAGHKTFLFTSAVVSEGKSFCATNCAVAFAQQGLKTLLIDADLRSPSIGGIFFDGAPVQGLTDALTHRTDLDHAARPTGIDNLFLLCAGSRLYTLTELLAGEAFGQLIKEAMAKFDRVVVDSSPIQAVSDTLLLAGHVQATCLVISAQTSAEVVSQAVRKLGDTGSTLVGFVLNRVSRHHGADYYSYRYSQAACTRANAGSRERSPKPPTQLQRPGL